jgi:phosphoribosyl-AMP cyclohydrolase / phosphoribosyl-ATP pyrophosphohydrolase
MRPLTRQDLEQDRIRFTRHLDAPPLVPVVTQDATTGAVLMMAWADEEALIQSLETGDMHYHSRSRGRLWRKGEESGHTQRIVSLHLDCDHDTILARVKQEGPACHTQAPTCFHEEKSERPLPPGILGTLAQVIEDRAKSEASGSYTAKLLGDENLRLKKLMEEAGELQVELARGNPQRAKEEAADLVYHALVALHAAGVGIEDVLKELADRRK